MQDRTRLDKLMADVDQLLGEPTGAEQLIRTGESLVRRINDAFGDGDIPFEASLDVRDRSIHINPIPLSKASRVVCRIEDVSRIVESKEKGN